MVATHVLADLGGVQHPVALAAGGQPTADDRLRLLAAVAGHPARVEIDGVDEVEAALHCLVLDGVYRPGANGTPELVQGLAPPDAALQAVLHQIITRITQAAQQLQALGILGCSHGRIEVLQPQRLDDVASGKLVLCTSGG